MGFAWRSNKAAENGQACPSSSAVGIDLGTSFVRVALWQDGDVLMIPNDRGSLGTPACVAFTESSVLVGEAAEEQADSNMENTIFAPQRLVGFRFDNPWVQWYARMFPSKIVRGDNDMPMLRVMSNGKERRLYPEDIVTMLLAHLRKIAEAHLGVPVMDVVVTVPARYGKTQREAIVKACRGARLNVLDLIKSPTAAAVAYTLTNHIKTKRHVLVCDMGATYFDFSLLSISGGCLVERAIGTDYVDLDNCLLQFCIEDLKEKWNVCILGQQLTLQRLRRACEVAKKKLSQGNQTRIEVRDISPGVDYLCVISRVHFEELCKDDIRPLLDPIAWCLEDCGLEKHDVQEVVLLGGSARIPAVRRAMREFFYGKKPLEVVKPDHAAVLGAAAYVAMLTGMTDGNIPAELKHIQLTQVTPWSSVPLQSDLDYGADVSKDEAASGSPPPPKPVTRASFSKLLRPSSTFGDQEILVGDLCAPIVD